MPQLEADLVKSLEEYVMYRLSEARRRKSSLLWTPGSNPVTAVVEALADYVSSLQRSPSQPEAMVDEAAQLLLREEPSITDATLSETVEDLALRIRERLAQQKFSIKTRNELGLVFVLEVVRRLTLLGALSSSACAALTLSVNTLDDATAQSMSGVIYSRSLRPLLLFQLSEVAMCLQEGVRHTDLILRSKHAVMGLTETKTTLPGASIDRMRELARDLKKRIQETHDGPGPGPCPDGSPATARRQAGRTFQLGQLKETEAYVSLPLLRSQLLRALGHLLVKGLRGAQAAALEEAFGCFAQACDALRGLGQWEAAAQAAVCATECLDRLVQSPSDSAKWREALVRLLDYGADQNAWVLSCPLHEPQRHRYAKLLKAAIALPLSWAPFLDRSDPPAPSEESQREEPPLLDRIQKLGDEALIYLRLMSKEDAGDSWLALNLGWAAWVRFRVLLSFIQGALYQHAEPKAAERSMDKWRERVRGALSQNLIDSFLSALEGAQSAVWSAEHQLEVAHGVLGGEALLLSSSRFQEVLLSFLDLMAEIRQEFTTAQLTKLQELLNRLDATGLPIRSLLKLVKAEPTVLGRATYRNFPLGSACEYFEKRLEVLNREVATPYLSASERLLLSSWISHLLMNLRMSTDDLRELPPARALALLDASGASSFRAETLLYGRGEAGSYPEYTNYLAEDMVGAVERDASSVKPEEKASTAGLFSNLHDARHELDLWGRLTMIIEASQESPYVREVFKPRLTEASHRIWAFPPTYPLDQITLRTGARPEDITQTEKAIVVRMEMLRELPRSHEHLERARNWLGQAVDLLLAEGLIPHREPAPLATAERVEDWLAAHPTCAIVVPGTFPECARPLSVFFHSEGSVTRHQLGTNAEKELRERIEALPTFMKLTEAMGEDQREVSKTSWAHLAGAFQQFSDVFTNWSRDLADLLERHGLREVLFLLRGREFVYIPWEELRTAPGGPRLGERFAIGYLNTLAPVPAPVSGEVARQGVLQLHGDGVSLNQMKMARFFQEALVRDGAGKPPLSGSEARDARRFQEELRSASRLRLFLHGHHDQLNPESDRITLVDAERAEERVNLQAEVLRSLPLAGVECVELWACEGSAHGRSLGEHGAIEAPEDLSTSFLLAGARRVLASLWHVPALPSALLMERFALLVHEGIGEATALARARSECRAAFEPGGLVEREMEARVAPRLTALATESTAVSDEQLLSVLEPALNEALQLLREGWRVKPATAPQSIPELSQAMGRLIKYSAPRPERLAAELRTDPEAVGRIIRDWLSNFRNPMCWAGWRIIVRGLEDWRP
ncbi:CHAT domain-containing protein [Stigmatella erecta]|uniref:CHAT domain-containing protein n=1 Tax=Stigmatella erecta TaxID=83460 RepID=A0A1H9YQD5_9BACT|nr:CHAT domain-containing protein [Stigmatella erecta]SES71359.1 CHAT domain-containing protein [Stigmatella erecta]